MINEYNNKKLYISNIYGNFIINIPNIYKCGDNFEFNLLINDILHDPEFDININPFKILYYNKNYYDYGD